MKASSSAWVGCSWVPSPALTTLERTQPELASRCGAPLAEWRTTTASAPIASSVSAVSFRLSPLDSEEPLAAKLMTSAESRLAAASKEMRVRVESSKKRLTTVRPRSAGSFLIGRSASERSSSAVSRTSSASSRLRSPALSRWRFMPTPPGGAQDGHGVDVVDAGQGHPDPLHQRGREVLADEVGPDRQLAVAPVDQDGEADRLGPPDVAQRVERRADGAAGEEHVVDQHDGAPSTPPGGIEVGSSARAGLSRRSSRYIVTSSEPTGTSYPSTAAIRSAIRSASGTPRLGMPSSTQVRRALVALQDLVGDAGQRPRDVTRVEDGATGAGGLAGCVAGRTAGRVGHGHRVPDLLLRLTGRLVKGCRSASTLPAGRPAGAHRAGQPAAHPTSSLTSTSTLPTAPPSTAS